MFGSRMEVTVPLELKEATQELHMLKALMPQLGQQDFDEELVTDPTSSGGRQPKWPKSHQKGQGKQGGKGDRQGAHQPSTTSWPREAMIRPPRRPRDQEGSDVTKQLAEMRSTLGMLTTLVLRQEIQQSIGKQDTAFVLFIDTRGPKNLATGLCKMGKTWQTTKRDHPDRLTAPMRAILFQHLLETVLQRFKDMTDSPSARSTAQNLGLLMPNGTTVPALKWDPANRQHVPDTTLETMETQAIQEALEELIALSTKHLVIHRFHGMRKLSEEYTSPTLGMFLEIGMRTPEAHATWNHLHRLQQSAAWQAAGVFLRHERMSMSALAKRVAALSK